jgi:hypothetical protein
VEVLGKGVKKGLGKENVCLLVLKFHIAKRKAAFMRGNVKLFVYFLPQVVNGV